MKKILIDFLKAYQNHDKVMINTLIDENTRLNSSMVGQAQGKKILDLLKIPFQSNVDHMTFTNYIEQDNECIACFHHLLAIDEDHEFYPFLYGGKIQLIQGNHALKEINMQLEYEYGNTYVVKDWWKLYAETKNKQMIYVENLDGHAKNPKEALYKFFLAMDLKDVDLMKAVCAKDIEVIRKTENGTEYGMKNIEDCFSFIEKDKAYYEQGQYSIHIKSCDLIETGYQIQAWHLDPGRPGNKHLCNATEFSQFFNEIIEAQIFLQNERYVIQRISFKHKENPVLYGWTLMEL